MARRQGFHIDLPPPHDREAPRNRFWRWVQLIVVGAVIIAAPILLGIYWGSLFHPIAEKVGLVAGIIAGAIFLIRLGPRLLVYNREWSAYVTQNAFAGTNVPYGPGLHPSLLWEERNKSGNYSLEPINNEFTLSVQTKTAQVHVEGNFQWAVNLATITTFIGVDEDETTIREGFLSFIMSFLTGRVANKTAEQTRASIDELNEALALEFMGLSVNGQSPVTFETKYGIRTVSVVLKEIRFPEAAQKTRDAIDEAETLHTIMAKLRGVAPRTFTKMVKEGQITQDQYDKLLNRAMATSDNAQMNINVIEGDLGGALATGLARFLGGTGGARAPSAPKAGKRRRTK